MQCFKNPDLAASSVSFISLSIDMMRDLAVLNGVCTGFVLVQAFSRHSSLGRLGWIYMIFRRLFLFSFRGLAYDGSTDLDFCGEVGVYSCECFEEFQDHFPVNSLAFILLLSSMGCFSPLVL